MEKASLIELLRQGLGTVRGGLKITKMESLDIGRDVHCPELKDELLQSHRMVQQWSARCEHALKEIAGEVISENPILKAHYIVSTCLRQEAANEDVRDLGIIASDQIALHYWIATFGSLRTYAQDADLPAVARDLEDSMQEAVDADKRLTQIAYKIMGDAERLRVMTLE